MIQLNCTVLYSHFELFHCVLWLSESVLGKKSLVYKYYSAIILQWKVQHSNKVHDNIDKNTYHIPKYFLNLVKVKQVHLMLFIPIFHWISLLIMCNVKYHSKRAIVYKILITICKFFPLWKHHIIYLKSVIKCKILIS